MVSLGYIVTPRILSEKWREEGKREKRAMARKKGKLGKETWSQTIPANLLSWSQTVVTLQQTHLVSSKMS